MAMRHSGTLKARNVDEGEVTCGGRFGRRRWGALGFATAAGARLLVGSARRQDRRTHDRLAGLREVIERQRCPARAAVRAVHGRDMHECDEPRRAAPAASAARQHK